MHFEKEAVNKRCGGEAVASPPHLFRHHRLTIPNLSKQAGEATPYGSRLPSIKRFSFFDRGAKDLSP